MHTLIIKGDTKAAFDACGKRGIEITSIVQRNVYDDVIVTVPGTTPLVKITDWFLEDGDEPPFPTGSLLWYGPAKHTVSNEAMDARIEVELFYSRAAGAHINLNKSVVGEDDQ